MKNSVPSAKPQRKARAMPGQWASELAQDGVVSSCAPEVEVMAVAARYAKAKGLAFAVPGGEIDQASQENERGNPERNCAPTRRLHA